MQSLDTPAVPSGGTRSADDAPDVPFLTYEPFYGLREKPFSLSSDPRFLYKSPAHATAFERLEAGIRRREGLIVLSGEIGTGKTTLCRAVLAHLDRRTFSTFVPDPFVTRQDLLKMLLVGFGVMSPADVQSGRLATASRQDLSYPLYEFLDSLVPLHAFAVLVIDEAQNLTPGVLEEIRILAELEKRHKLLQVVLVGQPELRDNLRQPELRQVEQRVSVRCELTPLEGDGITRYVAHRLSVAAGGESRVAFSASAIAAVGEASGGVPRLVNRICDRALHVGWVRTAATIDAETVRAALDDLGMDAGSTSLPSVAKGPVGPRERPRSQSAQMAKSTTTAESVVSPPAPPATGTYAHAPIVTPTGSSEAMNEFAQEPAIETLLKSGTAVQHGVLQKGAVLKGGAAVQPRSTSSVRRILLPGAAALALATIAGSAGVFDVSALLGIAASSPLPPTPASPYDVREGTTHGILPPDEFQATLTEARQRAADVYTIHVGSFASRSEADHLVEELVSRGHRTRLVQVPGHAVGAGLQIVVEGYGTLEDALAVVTHMRRYPGGEDASLIGMPGGSSRTGAAPS